MALGGIIKTSTVDDIAFVNLIVDTNSQVINQQQVHLQHQQYQHQQHQYQHESPSRFAPGFNLMRDNELDG